MLYVIVLGCLLVGSLLTVLVYSLLEIASRSDDWMQRWRNDRR